MEPISMILAAIVAGAAAGSQETASTAVKEGYANLKKALSKRAGPEAGRTIDEIELAKRDNKSSAALEAILRDSIEAHDTSSDPVVMSAARQVLQMEQGTNATFSNCQGIQMWSTGPMENHFN